MNIKKIIAQNIFISFCISLLYLFIPINLQSIEHYKVKKINSEIIIDGKLDELEWIQTDSTKNFVILGDNINKAKSKTWAKLLWDNDNLYIGFYCMDTAIWATYATRDDALYKEDVVEVFIDPNGDGKNYLEVEVNPLNTIFDLWLTKAGGTKNISWNMANLKSAISINGTIGNNADKDTAWTCEMSLPFSEMKFAEPLMNFPPIENDKWRLNLYRFDRSSTDSKIREATGWSQTKGGQHEPTYFGEIQFDSIVTDSIPIIPPIDSIVPNNIQSFLTTTDKDFFLQQNYPNPFSISTAINFYVPKLCYVKITVFNSFGKEIEQLINQELDAGQHKVYWNSAKYTSGIYFYSMFTKDYSFVKKMILLKVL